MTRGWTWNGGNSERPRRGRDRSVRAGLLGTWLVAASALAPADVHASTCQDWGPAFLLPRAETPVPPNVVVRAWVRTFSRSDGTVRLDILDADGALVPARCEAARDFADVMIACVPDAPLAAGRYVARVTREESRYGPRGGTHSFVVAGPIDETQPAPFTEVYARRESDGTLALRFTDRPEAPAFGVWWPSTGVGPGSPPAMIVPSGVRWFGRRDPCSPALVRAPKSSDVDTWFVIRAMDLAGNVSAATAVVIQDAFPVE